jgi:hypothetical protein
MLLPACTPPTKNSLPLEAYEPPEWPPAVGLEKQSGVARYITRGKMAFDEAVLKLKTLKDAHHD